MRLASQDGWTPLLMASNNGHSEVVDRLIASSAMVDAATKVMPRTHCDPLTVECASPLHGQAIDP
jgi:ankyrin repeat protein